MHVLTPKINNIIISNSYFIHWLSLFFLVHLAQTRQKQQEHNHVAVFPLATHCGVLLSPTHTPPPPTVSVRVSMLFWSLSQSLSLPESSELYMTVWSYSGRTHTHGSTWLHYRKISRSHTATEGCLPVLKSQSQCQGVGTRLKCSEWFSARWYVVARAFWVVSREDTDQEAPKLEVIPNS